MNSLKVESFFDLSTFEQRDLFAHCLYAWQGLERLSSYLQRHLQPNVQGLDFFKQPLPRTLVLWREKIWSDKLEFQDGDVTKGTFRVRIDGEEAPGATVLFAGAVLWDDRIYLGPGSVVEPGALIKGPTLIGSNTEVRQGAYIRGKCIVGNRCVVGHTTEIKAAVMLDDAKAGHFAYVGDSLLGRSSNLGAGTKLANLKMTEGNVRIRVGDETIDTGLRKLGAVIGDGVEIGCNAVTNPGTMLGKGCLVFPTVSVRAGYYEANSVIRSSS